MLTATTQLQAYLPRSDEWLSLASPALSGGIAAGTGCIFVASAGPAGSLTSGNTTTSVVISTVLPASVGVNQLANRGDGLKGFKIRIIGLSGGGSGKTEEKFIVANTSGTAPTITLDSALTFTPASGDRYEILSGRVFLLTTGPNFKYYDCATNSISSALTTTNLSAPTTEFSAIVLDEQYTPNTQAPGAGFFGNLVATATGSTSLTGTVAGGDSGVATNEYRNFQLRIVTDTGTPTAVGQRRKITSHTAGASPVYTVSAWTVTPSSTATFVIEGNNDILLWTAAAVTTFSYAAGGFAANASWSTSGAAGGATQYADRPSTMGSGTCSVWAYGITLDTPKNSRYSFIYSWRGGNAATLDLFDISAATTGTWTGGITYGNSGGFTPNTGTSGAYDPLGNGGQYFYINVSGTNRSIRFDVKNRVAEPFCNMRYTAGTALAGGRMALVQFIDGATTLGILHQIRPSNVEWFNAFCFPTV